MEHLPVQDFQPRIWVFLCDCCLNEPEVDKTLLSSMFPTNVVKVTEMCIGQSQPFQVRQAFEGGADGVLLCGCQVGKCKNSDNLGRLRIIHYNQKLLKKMGVEAERLSHEYLAPGCPKSMRSCIADFLDKIEKLGPAQTLDLDEGAGWA